MNAYEQKKAGRIERQRASAAKLQAEGDAKVARGSAMFDRIPFGQPVQHSHHSTQRDLNYRRKAHNSIGKGIELRDAAADLAARADRAEASTAVSSDDPDAVAKLRAKLVAATLRADTYAASIKLARKVAKPWTRESLAAGGVCAEVASFCVTMRFEPTAANVRADVRRIAARIAELEAKAAAPVREAEVFGDVEVREDRETNRLLVCFPGKPDEATRTELKAAGFRYAPSASEGRGAWQRQPSFCAWESARHIARKASGTC